MLNKKLIMYQFFVKLRSVILIGVLVDAHCLIVRH